MAAWSHHHRSKSGYTILSSEAHPEHIPSLKLFSALSSLTKLWNRHQSCHASILLMGEYQRSTFAVRVTAVDRTGIKCLVPLFAVFVIPENLVNLFRSWRGSEKEPKGKQQRQSAEISTCKTRERERSRERERERERMLRWKYIHMHICKLHICKHIIADSLDCFDLQDLVVAAVLDLWQAIDISWRIHAASATCTHTNQTLRGHRQNSPKTSETNKIRRGGGLQRSHSRLQTVDCIYAGLRVEAWSANFCSFRWEGERLRVKLILFVLLGFSELFAMAPNPFSKLLLK